MIKIDEKYLKLISPFLTKYIDHFGDVPCMGIENLSLESVGIKKKGRDKRVSFAGSYYYYMRGSLDEAFDAAGMKDIAFSDLKEVGLKVKTLFMEDAYYNFVIKKIPKKYYEKNNL